MKKYYITKKNFEYVNKKLNRKPIFTIGDHYVGKTFIKENDNIKAFQLDFHKVNEFYQMYKNHLFLMDIKTFETLNHFFSEEEIIVVPD